MVPLLVQPVPFLRRHRDVVAPLLCVLFLLSVCALLLFTTRHPLSLDDGLRHITIARHYREQGVGGVGGWGDYLFAGYFAQRELDPWFLADLLYVPFTLLPHPVLGLKGANLVFLLLLFLSFLPFLRWYRASPTLSCVLLLLLFFGSHGFTVRLFLARPFVVATALFLLAYAQLLKGRFLSLALLLTVNTLFSHLFVFSIFLCLSASLLFLILQRERDALLSAGATVGGTTLGILLHPQSGAYLQYLGDVFFHIPFSKRLGIGSELYSGFLDADILLFLLLLVIMLLFLLCRVRGALRGLPHQRPELVLSLFLSACFFLAYLLWVRAIDYLWPLLTVLVLQLATLTPAVEEEVLGRRCWLHLAAVLCIVNFGSIAALSLVRDASLSPALYSAVTSIPSGSRVLNLDWDTFPVLFFLNDTAQYARGMDPSFDYYADPAAFALLDEPNDRWSWVRMAGKGSMRDTLQDLRERFDARRMQLHIQRESADLNAARWLEDVQSHFAADYLVLKKRAYPVLIAKLRALDLPLYAESRALMIFSL